MKTLFFGRYAQAEDGGVFPIEWLVLKEDTENNRVLLLSRYALGSEPHTILLCRNPSWDNSHIKSVLNGSFLDSAFSPNERRLLLRNDQKTSSESEESDEDADDLFDGRELVFLLDAETIQSLALREDVLSCSPTDYAIKNGTWYDMEASGSPRMLCEWWLKDTGNDMFNMAYVDCDGRPWLPGCDSANTHVGIRPAVWLNLTAYRNLSEGRQARTFETRISEKDGRVSVEFRDTLSGITEVVENNYSPDDHRGFDESVGSVLYKWLSLFGSETVPQ